MERLRPTLAFYQDPTGYGGAVTYVERLLRWIDPAEFKVVVISPRNPSLAAFYEALASLQVQTIELPETAHFASDVYRQMSSGTSLSSRTTGLLRSTLFRPLSKTLLGLLTLARDVLVARRICPALREARAQILHVNLDHFPDSTGRLALAFARRCGIPSQVATLHAIPQHPVSPARIWHHFDRRGMQLTDRLIALTPEVGVRLRDWYGAAEESIVLIPNGAAVECFDQRPSRRTRTEFDIRDDDILVVHVGSLTPRRGQLVLTGAMRALSARCGRARAIFVGGISEPEYGRRFKEELGLQSHPQMQWLGYRRDALEIMRLADIAVLSSFEELHPFALLEAMALGKAIVATRMAVTEDVLDGGECGLLVKMGDSEEMAAAIEKLYRSPQSRARLGNMARRRAKERFSEERVGEQTVGLFRGLLTVGAGG